MPTLAPSPKQQFFTNAGEPAAGYKLYTYAAGTTTPQATYSDRAGLAANANPIILDARGEATVYLSEGQVYDFVFSSPDDTVTWTQPGVENAAGVAVSTTDDVTFPDAAATAYLKTQSDINNGLPVSLHRFIDPTKLAAIRNFTSTYDAGNDIRTAFASGVRALEVPAGRHNYSGNLTRSGQGLSLRGAGSGSSIIRALDAGGMVFNGSGEHNYAMPRFELEGVRLEAGVANAGTAVRISNTGGSGYAGVGAWWRDVEIVPSGPGTYWTKGVHATNLRNTRFTRVVVGGNAIVGQTTHGFHLDGEADPVEVWWDGFCYLYVLEQGILVEGQYEGIYLNGINMTSVRDGIRWDSSTPNPVLHVMNSYINCQRIAVDTDRISYFKVQNTSMSSSGLSTGDFTGVRVRRSFGDQTQASDISNNTFIGGNGYVENGVDVVSGNSISVHGNTFYSMTGQAIRFQAGAGLREYDNAFPACVAPAVEKPAAVSSAGGSAEVLLRAHGNGDAQSVSANTPTKLTFGALQADSHGYFDTANSRWTPPSGTYRIHASAAFDSGVLDSDILNVEIRRNGLGYGERIGISIAARAGLAAGTVDAIVEANGQDYFEVWVVIEGAAGTRTRTISTALNYWDAEVVR